MFKFNKEYFLYYKHNYYLYKKFINLKYTPFYIK